MCCEDDIYAPPAPIPAGTLQCCVTKPAEGLLGIYFEDRGFDGVRRIIVITEPGTHARNAGVQPNDRLVGLADNVVTAQTTVDRVVTLIRDLPPGSNFTLQVFRPQVAAVATAASGVPTVTGSLVQGTGATVPVASPVGAQATGAQVPGATVPVASPVGPQATGAQVQPITAVAVAIPAQGGCS
jgi:hypothetical protein